MDVMQPFICSERERILYGKANELSIKFSKRAALYDKEGEFPFENFKELKSAGFLKLTVPAQFGGDEISLYEFLLIQEAIARGDGPTALSLGWHLGFFMNQALTGSWPEKPFAKVCSEAVTKGILINSVHSEQKTGSPARGGKPETAAEKKGGKWVISGRKNFASMAPALDYFIITATLNETGEVAEFLVPKEADGISIIETWDTLGMRATRSDDVSFNHVILDDDCLVKVRKGETKGFPQAWLLHIPACYLGIAASARDYCIEFAKTYQPNSLDRPIGELPDVRRRIGEMEIKLSAAHHYLYSVAARWD